ncbi:MAG: NUDIX hydrolase [Thalassovita sp.]
MSYVRLQPSPAAHPVLPAKTQLRTQFAALCFRNCNKKTEVLLITSRKSGKWILPKGWPMKGRLPTQVAAQEAWEEAGVRGTPIDQCLGLYSYTKNTAYGVTLPCIALIYPVQVDCVKKRWPEVGQRRRKWFSTKKAARKVHSPELARALRDFDPARLKA